MSLLLRGRRAALFWGAAALLSGAPRLVPAEDPPEGIQAGAAGGREPSAVPPGSRAPAMREFQVREPFRVESLWPAFVIFRHPLLVEALGLSPGQLSAAAPYLEAWFEDARALQEELARLEAGLPGDPARLELQRRAGQRRLRLERECRAILSPSQTLRLRQISLQLGGLQVCRDRTVLAELAITGEELASIQRAVEELVVRGRRLETRFRAGELSAVELEAMRSLARQETRSAVEVLLGPSRRRRLAGMKGTPVAFGRDELFLALTP